MDVRCVVNAHDQLGEGPCWSPLEGRLYWFDIKGHTLNWLEPAGGMTGGYALKVRASVATPRRAAA